MPRAERSIVNIRRAGDREFLNLEMVQISGADHQSRALAYETPSVVQTSGPAPSSLVVDLLTVERCRGLPGYRVVPLQTCRGPRPRRARRPHTPWPRVALPPSGTETPSALGTIKVSGLVTHGPPVHAPTHRRQRRRSRRKAHFRPAWLWLWPGGIPTLWTTCCISGGSALLPCRPAWPGRTSVLFL